MVSAYRMPAEWEQHDATWLVWPKDPLTWPDRLPQAENAYLRMIEALAPGEKVRLLVDDEETKEKVLKELRGRDFSGVNLDILILPTADSWIRDYGPIFARRPELVILDWIFNAWGNKYPGHLADDPVPQKLGPLLNLPVVEPGIVLEGGSIEVNGQGTLLTTEQCLLNPNRNPDLKRAEIEEFLGNFLGARRVLWLGEGIAGDDTDGHVDDIARFVAPDTVVAAVEEDPADENFKPLRENLLRLREMKDAEGRPLKVVEIPMPRPLFSEEGRLPASYANFYIANQVVLVPTFRDPNDRPALEVLEKLFPTRRVIGIEAQDLVWGMGAFHCLTQQQPAV